VILEFRSGTGEFNSGKLHLYEGKATPLQGLRYIKLSFTRVNMFDFKFVFSIM
jgi:hypothetical protein